MSISIPRMFAVWLCLTAAAFAAEPRVLDDRLKLELFAEQPQIVTPTGIDVDHLGRVWAIESNTHFPPEGYQGHSSDRLLVMEDTNADGRADKVTMFADGFRHAMSVVAKPVWLEVDGLGSRVEGQKKTNAPIPSGPQPSTLNSQPTIFLATRREILLLGDTDGDNKCDERRQLVRLETKGDYPHNGLAGIAFDALGWMFFGFGENLGEDYKIIGSDGVTLSGGGEGGNIYRCRPDGTKLEKWATGFWNPHASTFDAFGRLFTVDNDPDSRPPCRLLHIIQGGDYGYRFRNGRKGTHPFTAWNGEIPGTLPMVSGTGEAPSGILCYESDGFPEDYLGTLLVGSWGDHRVDKFVLEPKGASFTSKPQPIVQGDENFRPVGLALAPDGSVYFTDWVLRDYKLHGKGRVWRLSPIASKNRKPIDLIAIRSTSEFPSLHQFIQDKRLSVRRTAVARMMDSPIGVTSARREFGAVGKGPITRTQYELVAAAYARGLFPSPDRELLDFEVLRGDSRNPNVGQDPFAFSRLVRLKVNGELSSRNDLDDSFRDWSEGKPSPWFDSERWSTHALSSLLALRQLSPRSEKFVRQALGFAQKDMRFAAIQWVGEEKLTALRPEVEAFLQDPTTTPDLLLACLATLSLLDGLPASEFEKTPPAQYALAMVVDDQRPAALRATALRLIPPALPELKGDLLVALAKSSDKALQTEAVRTLQQSPRPEALSVLLKLANDANADVDLRADAVSALCAIVPHEQPLPSEVEQLLLNFANARLRFRDSNEKESLQLEAIRSLRGRAVEGSKIRAALETSRETASVGSAQREALDLALTGKSALDPQSLSDSQPSTFNSQPSAGRRTFFAHQGAQCCKCHTVHGRGGNVGPDLSVVARTMSRQKLIESILDPSKEISPYFLTWSIATTSGKVYTGLIVTENGGGDVQLGDAQGNVIAIPRKDIEERSPQKISVMPQGLHRRMTAQEFADLIAWLETLK